MKTFSPLLTATALLAQLVFAFPTERATVSKHSNTTATTAATSEYVVLLDNTSVNRATVHDILDRLSLTVASDDVITTFDNSAFTGFVARMGDHSVKMLGNMTEVSSMDMNEEITSHATARLSAPWGLERVSSAATTIAGNTASLGYTYSYQDPNLGKGVDIYIIDTGVQTSHDAFSGRATMGFTITNSTVDGDGHGTHVAGTAAGIVVGMSSNANIIGVKVLKDDGSGTTSDTIQGIDWAVANHDSRKSDSDFVGSIFSLSLGLKQRNSGLENALLSATKSGIHVSLAAGNLGLDACNYAPAAIGGAGGAAVSVGSIGPTGAISSFSNRGKCVDVYAPGENVISSWIGPENNLIHMLDGTSMACPHVTGLMAYYMVQYPQLAANPAGMKSFLASTARKNIVSGTSLSGDLKLLISNGLNGPSSQVKRSALIPVTRRDNSVLGRLRRSISNVSRRWVYVAASEAVSIEKRGFELISDESPLRY